jgi:transposase, IS30 family
MAGRHLTLEERERLATSRAEGLSLRAIATRLGRAVSTISRELRRNALPKGGYLPVHAEGCYLERRQRPAVLERDAKLARFVRERLLEGWTPEQIAGWLRRGEERRLRPVSTETIYAFVHRPGQKGEKLWKLLPRRGGPDVAGGGLVSRAASSPGAAPSTTDLRASRGAARLGTGRATC